MPRSSRLFTAITAAEVVLVGYGSIIAFLSPSQARQHNLVLALALLSAASLLAWHVTDSVRAAQGRSDPMALRVIVPNAVLLILCLTGSLQGTRSSNALLAALVSCAALAMLVGGVHLGRTRQSGAVELTSS